MPRRYESVHSLRAPGPSTSGSDRQHWDHPRAEGVAESRLRL